MVTTVALLRGINVGGRSIRMDELKAAVSAAGGEDVRSYIQSGNLMFNHRRSASAALVGELEARITEATGRQLGVVLRSATDLAAVIADNPFPPPTHDRVHVAFLPAPPSREEIRALEALEAAPEQVAAHGREVYLHLPLGSGRAKLPPLVLRLDLRATIRNLRTVTKLAEISAAEPFRELAAHDKGADDGDRSRAIPARPGKRPPGGAPRMRRPT